MTMMDERVAQRRRGVFEDRARTRLRKILIVLVMVLVIVGGFWLLRSPVLSISRVEITGAQVSDPAAAVDALGMGVGRPTIDVNAGAIELRIEADPWVADASVSIVWPGTLVVDVVEHRPLTVAVKGDAWVLMSVDGAVLADADGPSPSDSAVAIDLGSIGPGSSSTDPLVLGSLAFIDALPPDLRGGTVVASDGNGLVATVAGHEVRLGRPVEMGAKAAAIVSLIAAGVEEGADVNLIAPLRPAVSVPGEPEA
jgi:cell division protein FtsQ